MAAQGYVFKDGGPIPDDELQQSTVTAPGEVRPEVEARDFQQEHNQPRSPTTTKTVASTAEPQHKPVIPDEHPTVSHELANAPPEIKGLAQVEHKGKEVKDLGWTDDSHAIPRRLVGGINNEDLWLLIRRFNKQLYHVKATNAPAPGGLDLYIADEDDFSPDKLRASLERFYMTVVVGAIAAWKHIARLRSWREPRRTAWFMAGYTAAWLLDMLIPAVMVTIILLIMYPPARDIMFPHAPIALVDHKTGGIKSPSAGVLGSHDSVTGAPENFKGEAVEQEASNFVNGFATIAMSSATGKHEPAEPASDALSSGVPDPTKITNVTAEAQTASTGGKTGEEHDKTKKPMEEAMWSKMRPIMHGIGDVSDGYERFANALSPTPPFPEMAPRLRLAACLLPVLLISVFTSSYMFMKANTFFVGFGFFGDPVIGPALRFLNREFPHWQKLLEIRNTILAGVPTNAQLAITLLRIGEANRAPLPPPPRSDEPLDDEPTDLDTENLTLDASHAEIQDAITKDSASSTGTDVHDGEKPKHRTGQRIISFLKGGTKAAVETKLGTDHVRATIGSQHAKNHLGVLAKSGDSMITGPVEFKARYHGKKGYLYINTAATVPCVAYSSRPFTDEGERMNETIEPIFTIPISEIRELKKVGGMGWKAKLIVGWATSKKIIDGLEITDEHGKTWHVTAIPLRDELFNRLVAMGQQKWVSW